MARTRDVASPRQDADHLHQLWAAGRDQLSPRGELAVLARALWRCGYRDDARGHITYRQPDGTILTNAYGLTWAELTAADVVAIDGDGRPLDDGGVVTPAIGLHLEVHRRRPDCTVVVHHHPDFGTVWAGAGRMPPAYDQTSACVDDARVALVAEYGGSFADRSAATTAAEEAFRADYMILGHHGVVVVADEVWQAYWRAYCLEWRARLAWRVEVLGGSDPFPAAAQQAILAQAVYSGIKNVLPWQAAVRRELREDPDVLDEERRGDGRP